MEGQGITGEGPLCQLTPRGPQLCFLIAVDRVYCCCPPGLPQDKVATSTAMTSCIASLLVRPAMRPAYSTSWSQPDVCSAERGTQAEVLMRFLMQSSTKHLAWPASDSPGLPAPSSWGA